eukprot:gene25814-11489_t
MPPVRTHDFARPLPFLIRSVGGRCGCLAASRFYSPAPCVQGRGCYFIGVDADLDVAPGHEPATGSDYPILESQRLDPNNADPDLAAVITATRITSQKNYQAFMIVIQSLSKPIQTALLTTTEMANKAIRFLKRLYGAVAGDVEF